jgi:hypothetical protein
MNRIKSRTRYYQSRKPLIRDSILRNISYDYIIEHILKYTYINSFLINAFYGLSTQSLTVTK